MDVLGKSSDGIVARARFVVVSAWVGPIARSMAEVAHQAMRQASTEHPGDAVYVNVIGPRVPAPDSSVREVFVDMIRESPGGVCCAAIVSEAGGFQGAIVRAVTAGLLLTIRPRFPMSVCTGFDDTERWLLGAVAGAKGPAYVHTVIDVARRARAMLDAR